MIGPTVKRLAKAHLPASWLRRAMPLAVARAAQQRGLAIHTRADAIDIVERSGTGRVVRIAREHAIYLPDIVVSFDYYHGAVAALPWNGLQLVDYSTPRYHDVVGFDDFPVLFPSLCEPLVTTRQYLDFAALGPGMVVLDLGAYAGLTSIQFALAVVPGGRVIAVDADARNLACLRRNVARFERLHGAQTIEVLHAAMWSHDEGVEFSQEGNMGASVADIVGRKRGALLRVPSLSLSSLAQRCGLTRVDFVKCDIEGAEVEVLRDEAFFGRFRPRVIVEVHDVDGRLTDAACVESLSRFGYRCRRIVQHGVAVPLLECTPAT